MNTRAVIAIVVVAAVGVTAAVWFSLRGGGDPAPAASASPSPGEQWATVSAADPYVIFAPVPPNPDPASIPLPHGSDDYLDLFAEGAPWDEAAGRVDAFVFPAWYVRIYASNADLRQIISGLESRGITMGISLEPLEHPDPAECAQTESFEGTYDFEQVERLQQLGADIGLVVIDEPYWHAHKMVGPGWCNRPVDQVAEETAAFMDRVKALYPDVTYGSIEPLTTVLPIDGEDVDTWLTAYEEAAGEPFDFFLMDVAWEHWDVAEVAPIVREMEGVADAHGMPSGLIYIGDLNSTSDAQFAQTAAEHFWDYEQYAGGTPEVVSFMSWVDRPYRVLPETDPASFTSVINRYFSTRTELQADAAAGPDELIVDISVLSDTGKPVAGAAVEVSVLPTSASGQAMAVTSVVPDNAVAALIGFRSNAEGAIDGPVDADIYDVSFDAGDGNVVPNSSFSSGLNSWGTEQTNRAKVSTVGGDMVLTLRADPGQPIYVNGESFAVTAGDEFVLSATVSVGDGAALSSLVTVMFLDADGDELRRTNLPIEPLPVVLGTPTTDAAGVARVTAPLPAGAAPSVRVAYVGDADHWPSWVAVPIELVR